MFLYQSQQRENEKTEQGFDPHLSSPGNIHCVTSGFPLRRTYTFACEKIAGQTEQRHIFIFNPLYKAPAPGKIGEAMDYFLQYGPKCIFYIFK